MNKKRSLRVIVWDDIVMMILALVSGYLLALEFTANLTETQMTSLMFADTAIALVFLSEFIIKFSRAEQKLSFLKSHWWYLLASIPITTPITQALRLIRLLSLIRLVRLIRLSVGISDIIRYWKHFIKQTYLIHLSTIFCIIVFSGTLIFYVLEHPVNANIKNLFDSLWWVMTTITTVGYGDIYPLTTAGRVLGILLMISGIGISTAFAALVASFFIKGGITQHQKSK